MGAFKYGAKKREGEEVGFWRGGGGESNSYVDLRRSLLSKAISSSAKGITGYVGGDSGGDSSGG